MSGSLVGDRGTGGDCGIGDCDRRNGFAWGNLDAVIGDGDDDQVLGIEARLGGWLLVGASSGVLREKVREWRLLSGTGI